jgi:hypothetical protein
MAAAFDSRWAAYLRRRCGGSRDGVRSGRDSEAGRPPSPAHGSSRAGRSTDLRLGFGPGVQCGIHSGEVRALAGIRRLRLSPAPKSVDLCVVHPEEGVRRRREEAAHGPADPAVYLVVEPFQHAGQRRTVDGRVLHQRVYFPRGGQPPAPADRAADPNGAPTAGHRDGGLEGCQPRGHRLIVCPLPIGDECVRIDILHRLHELEQEVAVLGAESLGSHGLHAAVLVVAHVRVDQHKLPVGAVTYQLADDFLKRSCSILVIPDARLRTVAMAPSSVVAGCSMRPAGAPRHGCRSGSDRPRAAPLRRRADAVCPRSSL